MNMVSVETALYFLSWMFPGNLCWKADWMEPSWVFAHVHCVRLFDGTWLAWCGNCGTIRLEGRELSSPDMNSSVLSRQSSRRQAVKKVGSLTWLWERWQELRGSEHFAFSDLLGTNLRRGCKNRWFQNSLRQIGPFPDVLIEPWHLISQSYVS